MGNEIEFRLTDNNPIGQAGDVVRLDGSNVYVNGKRANLALTPSDVHVPSEMPTYLAGYRNNLFRADEVSPVIPVDKTSDYYRTFDEDDAFQHVNVKGSLEGNIPEVTPRSSTTKYETTIKLLGSFISDMTETNAEGSPYRPRQVAARNISRFLGLDREIDVFAMLTNTANWKSADYYTTLGATAKWNGGTDSDPIADLHARIEASAQEVTGIYMNRRVGNAFVRHPAVRDQMRQMLGDGNASALATSVAGASPTSSMDFAIPGLPPFHVVGAKVKDESSGKLVYVMSDDTLLTVAPDGTPTDGEEIATTYTFRLKGSQGVGFETREFRIENRGVGGTMVVAQCADVPIFTGKNCGGLIKACYQ